MVTHKIFTINNNRRNPNQHKTECTSCEISQYKNNWYWADLGEMSLYILWGKFINHFLFIAANRKFISNGNGGDTLVQALGKFKVRSNFKGSLAPVNRNSPSFWVSSQLSVMFTLPKVDSSYTSTVPPFPQLCSSSFPSRSQENDFPNGPGKVNISHFSDLSHSPSTNVHSGQKCVCTEGADLSHTLWRRLSEGWPVKGIGQHSSMKEVCPLTEFL